MPNRPEQTTPIGGVDLISALENERELQRRRHEATTKPEGHPAIAPDNVVEKEIPIDTTAFDDNNTPTGKYVRIEPKKGLDGAAIVRPFSPHRK